MARSKQATPIRRETSSEYFSKEDRAKPAVPTWATSEKATNGVAVAPTKKEEEAGSKVVDGVVIKLVVAVAGIYGSL